MMNRELLLLRHGKSDWSVNVNDLQRPLRDRGKLNAQRIGTWLAKQNMIPDLIITSPAKRAMATAQNATKAMGLAVRLIVSDTRIYEAGPEELLAVLQSCPVLAKRVLMVGHNPGLDELLVYLADSPVPVTANGKLMTTATLARLQMPDDWSSLQPCTAKLVDLIRPTTLPRQFPFPLTESTELRDRPAYYYRQASVIPYRLVNLQPQILLIRSRKAKHWAVPKGIIEPGLSPQQSAVQEALEEAGIEGVIEAQQIGAYEYTKWGGTCRVQVYPMRVTRVLSDTEWHKNRREITWMPPDTAAKNIKRRELKKMIRQFFNKIDPG